MVETYSKWPKKPIEVLLQPIWNNSKLKLPNECVFNQVLSNLGINRIADLLHDCNSYKKLENLTGMNADIYQKTYITWFAIINTVPRKWRELVKHSPQALKDANLVKGNCIFVDGGHFYVNDLTSKFIYRLLLNSEIHMKPTNQMKIDSRCIDTLDWENIYSGIYCTTLDTYSRQFQFRIVHNYICVNNNLKKWKIIDTDRCSYCFIGKESVEHIFVHVVMQLHSTERFRNGVWLIISFCHH